MKNIPLTLARLALPLFPAALALYFIRISFGTDILGFMPHYDVDQFMYWREMAAFAQSGFSGGYFGMDEGISRLKGFGPHGVAIAMTYGTLYSLMPWTGFAAIPVFNLALLTAALYAYVWTLRAGAAQTALACLAAALSPAVFLYLPTAFQDGLHCAAAAALAAFFVRLIEAGPGPGHAPLKLAAGVFLLLLCFVRYTWTPCLLPYFYLLLHGARWRLPLAAALGCAVAAAVVACFSLFVPAWYLAPDSGVHVGGATLAAKASFFAGRAVENLRALADVQNNRAAAAVLSGQAFFALAGLAALCRRLLRPGGQDPADAAQALLIAVNMLVLPAVLIVAWVGNGAHLVRLLSAHWLLCVLVAARFFPWRAVSVPLAYGAALMPMYMGIFQVYHLPGYLNGEKRALVERVAALAAPAMLQGAGLTPWDKTAFIGIRERGLAALGLPPWAGFQTASGLKEGLPQKSRYALVEKAPGGEGEWALMAATDIGSLYVRKTPGPGADGKTEAGK
jgi:hypothetical protein